MFPGSWIGSPKDYRWCGYGEAMGGSEVAQAALVIGSRGFVNEVFGVFRERFGPKRKDGARRMRYVAHGGLYSPRDLKREVVGIG